MEHDTRVRWSDQQSIRSVQERALADTARGARTRQMTEHLPAGELRGTELDDRRVEEILDAMGDAYARDVLAATCREPRSAQDIATKLDHSLQTVYRRLDSLEDHGLVTSKLQIAGDGNHYRVFEAAFDNVLISVEDEQYDVTIYQRESLPDSFTQLWSELSRA